MDSVTHPNRPRGRQESVHVDQLQHRGRRLQVLKKVRNGVEGQDPHLNLRAAGCEKTFRHYCALPQC